MKILIIGGSGRIGSAVAWDFARANRADTVSIAGRNPKALKRVSDWIHSEKLETHILDIKNTQNVEKLMKKHDIGVIALPDRRSSYKIIEAAIHSGLNCVDVLEEYHRRPELYENEGLEIPHGMSPEEFGETLHRQAIRNEVTVLDGMGFAPGISNLTLSNGINRVNAYSAVARVGGIPNKEASARHPLKYMITWSFAHVLREYMINVKIIEAGRIREVEATSGRERFRFHEFDQDEELECSITPGMPSFLHTMTHLDSFSEKTIRWPGHWQAIDTLKECGLLDLNPISFLGGSIKPRDVFLSIVEPRLRPLAGDEDICVMWNTAIGPEKRADFFMWTTADPLSGISAMAKVTGFSAAEAAELLSRGEIKEKGILAPEEAFKEDTYRKFIEGLHKKNITIVEKFNSSGS